MTDAQGAKIRGTYVKWAQGEKTRLQDVIEKKKGEVKAKEEEVAQAKGESQRLLLQLGAQIRLGPWNRSTCDGV
jgi:hypothetical protein